MPQKNGQNDDSSAGQGQGGTGDKNNAQQQGQQQAASQQAQQQQAPKDFEGWLAVKGDDTAKALYQQHITGLQNTVTATREERDALNNRIKGIAKTLGTDPEKAKSEMDKLSTDLQEANRKIEFLQDAGKPEIECLDTNLAWLLATSKGLFRANGSPDWPAIRKEAPRLFGKPMIDIGAGSGTGNGAGGKANMDDWIRQKAGVR
jgi:hypothetical protein